MKSAKGAGFAMLVLAVGAWPLSVVAQTVTGVAVPELAAFDTTMVNFMNANGIDRGVLAVSNNGCIVYQRGFDWPENGAFRLASVEKPITAAAIRDLYGTANLNNVFVFNGGTAQFNNGGVLSYSPDGGVAGTCPPGWLCLQSITALDLLDHRGGWDRTGNGPGPCLGCSNCEGCGCAKDPQFAELEIACDMGISGPALREDIIEYMLSQPLQFPAGGPVNPQCAQMVTSANGTGCYSNFGYMLLGKIIEEVSGLSHPEYIRQNVLTPAMWVPSTDIYWGRTYDDQHGPREPNYVCFYMQLPQHPLSRPGRQLSLWWLAHRVVRRPWQSGSERCAVADIHGQLPGGQRWDQWDAAEWQRSGAL